MFINFENNNVLHTGLIPSICIVHFQPPRLLSCSMCFYDAASMRGHESLKVIDKEIILLCRNMRNHQRYKIRPRIQVLICFAFFAFECPQEKATFLQRMYLLTHKREREREIEREIER